MPTIDLSACTGLVIIFLLALCFGTLVLMRDRVHAAPHRVSRLVWCPRHERTVWVGFTERVRTGMALRRVRHCPLRRETDGCGEGCAWETALAPPVPDARP